MANKKNKRKKITQKKEYKKEKALLLLAFSHMLELVKRTNVEISTNSCKNEYDLFLLKVYKWLLNIKKTYATKQVATYIDKRLNNVYKKYYSENNAPQEDLLNISLLFLYVFLEFIKHSDIKIFIPPFKSEEVTDFLDWYNEEDEINREAIKFVYRASLEIFPNKESVLQLKSIFGSLYGNITFEEIVNEQVN